MKGEPSSGELLLLLLLLRLPDAELDVVVVDCEEAAVVVTVELAEELLPGLLPETEDSDAAGD